jgi:hypothetical protein
VAEPRTAEAVLRDIEAEREALAEAVEDLRDRIGGAADVGSRLQVLAPAAFATGFVVSGGIGATMRYLARRGRER